ncbi:DUF342 domain-containing protein [Campylobacter sp. LR291e]|uniref:flagellar assembly protein A n=1 Tax=Campylobacter sp. LR291e TaxID=2593546 RepID=UPI001238F4F4|nr:flagellar assembly protein A [Campylobacter sp. LR291e]KAA6230731.1 DUF342 domain-containing protein [Campylobacter sp. LR291e]
MPETVTINTQNPYKDIFNVAKKLDIKVEEVDFNVLSFDTHYRFGTTPQWEEISEKDLAFFEKDEVFLKEDLHIQQNYKVEFFQRKGIDEVSNAIRLSANKNITRIVVQIDFTKLKYHDNLILDLIQTIYKKLIKLKFFLGIRFFDFKQNLFNTVAKHQHTPINEKIQLIVARGIDLVPSQSERLILFYKEKVQDYTLDEKLSGIIAVNENETILRHIQQKDGSPGKSLNLHFLKVAKPAESKTNFSCSENLKPIQNDGYVDYVSQKKGYVAENANSFDIANTIDFGSVDFKTVGIIKAGLDKNVKINIRLLSDMQDAVNSGVGIECEELNVAGSVAGNTNLRASKLNIDGTTHTKAKLYAKNEAYIKTHRGYIEGDIVNIDLLENGTIKARIVKIKKSLGGNIIADKIYIDTLTHNNFCTFFENAVVEKFEGENNKFHAKIKTQEKNYEQILTKLHDEILKLNKRCLILKQNLLANKSNIITIQKKMQELQTFKQEIPIQYKKILRDYQLLKKDFIKTQSDEKALLEEKNKFYDEFKSLQDELVKATFINKSGKWSEMCEIRFSLLEPKEDIFYASSANENFKYIGLKKQEMDNQEFIVLEKSVEYEEEVLSWLSQSKA